MIKDYLVIYEEGSTSWGAVAPDLPACVAIGDTREEAESLMRDAIAMLIEGLREDGLPIPQPTVYAGRVTVQV